MILAAAAAAAAAAVDAVGAALDWAWKDGQLSYSIAAVSGSVAQQLWRAEKE